jgi:hypothetical protein
LIVCQYWVVILVSMRRRVTDDRLIFPLTGSVRIGQVERRPQEKRQSL